MGLHLIAENSWWLDPSNWRSIAMMVCGLGLLIFVHELGHFLVAKACGVKCEKFYLGFDVPFGKMLAALFRLEKPLPIPSSIVKFTWGETQYGIGIVPLGGYVKMLGQDDNPAAAARERERSRIKKEGGEADGEGGDDEYVLDPRSYQAKNVPQRMAIISAGVAMNLLTAPIFAMIAYMPWTGGVNYTPCVVGRVVPGGPAEQAGMRPGDRILEIGGNKAPYEHLRFGWDLLQGIAMATPGQPLEILVRHKDGETQTLTVTPEKNFEAKGKRSKRATIGITPIGSTEVAPREYWSEDLPAAEAKPPLEGGDRIVAITPQGGERHPVDGDYFRLQSLLVEFCDVPITVEVERETGQNADGKPITETVDVTVQPNDYRSVGLVMRAEPISSIRPGSPAEAAGFKPGDRLLTIAGEKFGGDGIDPLLLSDALRKYYGQQIAIEVQRDGATVSLDVTPQLPQSFGYFPVPGAPVPAEAIGVNYPVTRTVDYVEPGSPAEKHGMQAGDKLLDATLLRNADQDEDPAPGLFDEKIELDNQSQGWPYVWDLMQSWPKNKVRLTFERGDKVQDPVELAPVASSAPNPDRGFVLRSAEETQTADSLGEAFLLGLRQTKEEGYRVFLMLKKLVTGEIPLTSIGGPGMIAVVATQQASQGPSTLLLFMTFLSVNLAIVNFLPIPVLDGGHMMFLIAEGVRGKPLDEKWLTGLTLIGFVFLMCLMVFVLGLDVFRFSGLDV